MFEDLAVTDVFPTPIWTVDLKADAAAALNARLLRAIDTLLAAHPPTLTLCGHRHLWQWRPQHRELIVGNGGAESMCGWCKDRWGVSCQIVPRRMGDYLGNSDPAAAGRAYAAMMTMRRLDIAAFEAAIAARGR